MVYGPWSCRAAGNRIGDKIGSLVELVVSIMAIARTETKNRRVPANSLMQRQQPRGAKWRSEMIVPSTPIY